MFEIVSTQKNEFPLILIIDDMSFLPEYMLTLVNIYYQYLISLVVGVLFDGSANCVGVLCVHVCV